VMRRLGWETVEDLATEILGQPLNFVMQAQRGDVVAHRGSLGVCLGTKCGFAGPAGLEFVPLRQCSAAWRV
jgi:hypothetical protein